MTITCGIQPTGIVTMAMKMLHNTCNMCIHDLPYTVWMPSSFGLSALKLWVYISDKSFMLILQPLHVATGARNKQKIKRL